MPVCARLIGNVSRVSEDKVLSTSRILTDIQASRRTNPIVRHTIVRSVSEWQQTTGFPDACKPTEEDIEKFLNFKQKKFPKELLLGWYSARAGFAQSESDFYGPMGDLLSTVFPLDELYNVETQTRLYHANQGKFGIPDAAEKDSEKRTMNQMMEYAENELARNALAPEVFIMRLMPDRWRYYRAARQAAVQLSPCVDWIRDVASDTSYDALMELKKKLELHRPKIHDRLFDLLKGARKSR